MIVADTSIVYALLDRRDERHREAVRWYSGVEDEMATTPLILAEIDHLAGVRAGEMAHAAFHRDLTSGAYRVEWWAGAERACVEIVDHYPGLGIGLADASLVALSARHGRAPIATFDERHFRALRPLDDASGSLTLWPADAG